MAGHSKWANIKHRKAKQDASRGKLFTKYIRELTTAAKLGGPDAGSNPRLRAVVEKALSVNMTRDVINRAIQRGAGGEDNDDLKEVTYEGYGVGGVAVIVETMTDNNKRTVADVRHAFSKYGGNLGTSGSVAYLFQRKGVLLLAPGIDEDQLLELALDAGADDVQSHEDGSQEVLTSPEAFSAVKDALAAAGFTAESAEITLLPDTRAELDADTAARFIKMLDALEDSDDVQNVYHNADISDDIMATLE